MYPKYRIVEMTDGTYNLQWKVYLFQIFWSNLSGNYKNYSDAKKYLDWSVADDKNKRERKYNRIKRIVEIT